MPPSLSVLKGTPALSAAPCRPRISDWVLAVSCSKKPGLLISRKVARPQAVATGLPDKVPAWYTPPSGAKCSMTARLPPKAASGMPPPMTLPSTVMSGAKPGRSRA